MARHSQAGHLRLLGAEYNGAQATLATFQSRSPRRQLTSCDCHIASLSRHHNHLEDLYTGIGGYGYFAANNSGCRTEGVPPSELRHTSGCSCAGDIRYIGEGTLGFWYKFYQGEKGEIQFGLQYSYITKDRLVGQRRCRSRRSRASPPRAWTTWCGRRSATTCHKESHDYLGASWLRGREKGSSSWSCPFLPTGTCSATPWKRDS